MHRDNNFLLNFTQNPFVPWMFTINAKILTTSSCPNFEPFAAVLCTKLHSGTVNTCKCVQFVQYMSQETAANDSKINPHYTVYFCTRTAAKLLTQCLDSCCVRVYIILVLNFNKLQQIALSAHLCNKLHVKRAGHRQSIGNLPSDHNNPLSCLWVDVLGREDEGGIARVDASILDVF